MYKLVIQNILGENNSTLRFTTVTKTNSDGSGLSIPFDPANTDYQAYLKWVEEGNTPLPAEQA